MRHALQALCVLLVAGAVQGAPRYHYKYVIGDILIRGVPTRNAFGTMSYLLGNLTSGEAAVIDSGGNTKYTTRLAEHYGLNITRLLQTHAHVDHIQGLPKMKKNFPDAALYLHKGDAELYENKGIPVSESMRLGGHLPTAAFSLLSLSVGAALPEPDVWVEDGDVVVAGGLDLKVLHTPGHSPGHVCYYAESVDYLFCGDLILGAGVGRTDLYGGDHDQLVLSIQKVCKEVFPNATILSGHAEPVELQDLVGVNPFVALPGGGRQGTPAAAAPKAVEAGGVAGGAARSGGGDASDGRAPGSQNGSAGAGGAAKRAESEPEDDGTGHDEEKDEL